MRNSNQPLQATSYKLQATREGFTLLEFLIYIALASTVSMIIGGSLITLSASRGLNESRAQVNSALNLVMAKIKDDLKNATMVTTPYLGSSSQTLTLLVNSEEIVYSIESPTGFIKRRVGNSPSAFLTSSDIKFDTENTSFEYIQNANLPLSRALVQVKVVLTAEYDTTDTRRTYSQQKRSTFSLGKLKDITRPSGAALTPTGTDFAGENIPRTP